MKDIEWINNLKIRASYGQTGNDQGIGYYPYQTLYELGKNNGTEAGMYFTSISNPDIMWETQVSTDAAIEFGLWDNKLSGSVEYFRKESKDLLFDVAQAYSTGVSTITKNIGKVSNYGVEINLDYRIIQSRDWNLSVGANATFLKNELKTLPDDMKENGYVNGSKKWMEGKSMYEFWLYQWQGVDPKTGNGYYLIDDGANVPEADKLTVNGKDYTPLWRNSTQ
jgi:outer membrane receptor protein involved in Fe transport